MSMQDLLVMVSQQETLLVSLTLVVIFSMLWLAVQSTVEFPQTKSLQPRPHHVHEAGGRVIVAVTAVGTVCSPAFAPACVCAPAAVCRGEGGVEAAEDLQRCDDLCCNGLHLARHALPVLQIGRGEKANMGRLGRAVCRGDQARNKCTALYVNTRGRLFFPISVESFFFPQHSHCHSSSSFLLLFPSSSSSSYDAPSSL